MGNQALKLSGIQILRAIAALMVLALHVVGEFQRHIDGLDHNLFVIGGAGVDIFFVISGFIICYTTRNTQSIKTFAIKRAARILPLYYSLTIGLFLVLLVAPDLVHSTEATFETLLKSLAFIPYEAQNGATMPLLLLGWTLNYEMLFYVVFGLALLAGNARIIIASAVFLSAVAFGLAYDGNNVPLEFWTNAIILEFLFGCLIFIVFEKFPQAFRFGIPIALIAAAMLLAQNFYPLDLPRPIRWGIPSALLVFGVLGIALPANRIVSMFERLGDASYSLYLIHPYILGVAFRVVMPFLGVSAFSITLATALTVFGTIIASLLLFYLLERPSNEWIRNRLLKPAKAPAATE